MSDCIGTGCKAAAMQQQIAELRAELAAACADRDEYFNRAGMAARWLDAATAKIEEMRTLLREARGWLGDNDAEESLIRRIDAALKK